MAQPEDFIPPHLDQPVVPANAATNLPVRRSLEWVNGVPVPVNRPIIDKPAIQKSMMSSLSLPYNGYWCPNRGEWLIEERFVGMTNIEVIAVRLAEEAAAGNLSAIKEIFDRTLGKPKQSVENTNLDLTYEDYLQMIADKSKPPEPQTVDISNL